MRTTYYLFALLAAESCAASGGQCPFGYDTAGDYIPKDTTGGITEEQEGYYMVNDDEGTMLTLFPCEGTEQDPKGPWTPQSYLDGTAQLTTADYDAVVNDITTEYNKQSATVSMNSNPRAAFAGCIVRLAGHDFMDFRKNRDADNNIIDGTSGGSDGCMSFEDGDNKGLAKCVKNFGFNTVYRKHCKKISLADYLVIAADAVLGLTAVKPKTYSESNKNTLELSLARKLRDGYKFGRITNEECDPEQMHHRMPNPEKGCDQGDLSLEDVFINNVYHGSGAAWTYTAAISGTHTLGSAKLGNSGYSGFWSDEHNQGWFNNDYFRSIIIKGWGPEFKVDNNPNKNQWIRLDNSRPEPGTPEGSFHKEIMLTSDMCLVYKNNPCYGECIEDCYKKQGKSGCTSKCRSKCYPTATTLTHKNLCCTWLCTSTLEKLKILNFRKDKSRIESYCGWGLDEKVKANMKLCCKGLWDGRYDNSEGDYETNTGKYCDSYASPLGSAYKSVVEYSVNITAFYEDFVHAWKWANENGHTLKFLEGTTEQISTEVYDCDKYSKNGALGYKNDGLYPCYNDHKCHYDLDTRVCYALDTAARGNLMYFKGTKQKTYYTETNPTDFENCWVNGIDTCKYDYEVRQDKDARGLARYVDDGEGYSDEL